MSIHLYKRTFSYFLFIAGVATSTPSLQAKIGNQRPNFILIMVDDMGYSDLGCFGGEINTPNFEQLTEKPKGEEDLKMEIYTTMINRVDQNLGRLFTKFKEFVHWDNTLILFLSDNGACFEQPNTTPNIPPVPEERYRTVSVDWTNAVHQGEFKVVRAGKVRKLYDSKITPWN